MTSESSSPIQETKFDNPRFGEGLPEHDSASELQRRLTRRSQESRLRELEAQSMEEGLPDGYRETSRQESGPHRQHRLSVVTCTHLCLLAGSIWGVLARKGLIVLTEYSGSYLSGVIWANFVACVVMGMAVESDQMWSVVVDSARHRPAFASKSVIPLYVGITTGFCGSCSSFSTFMLETVLAAANLPPNISHYPNAAYGILGALEVTISNVALSICGLRVGAHITRTIETSSFTFGPRLYTVVEYVAWVTGVLAYIVVVVLIGTQSHGAWRSWTFACLFAPWGTFARYWLSRKLNSLSPKFPVGTFTANFGGTILLSVFFLLATGKKSVNSTLPIVSKVLPCHVLLALDDGFCGCLTTVSTFAVELMTLSLSNRYIYGLASVIGSFCAMLLILGSYNWTVGFTSQVC